MAMPLFTARAKRDKEWWLIIVSDVPGALTHVRNRDDAGAKLREAIARALSIFLRTASMSRSISTSWSHHRFLMKGISEPSRQGARWWETGESHRMNEPAFSAQRRSPHRAACPTR